MAVQVPSRRARLRAETSAEIRATALKLMAEGGPDAISLRAIAREMGMTANAIYGYYPTRDDLITTLITEVYGDLVRQIEAARDAAEGPAGRLLAWAHAFRAWSLANPEGFRLIYGDPVPGYQPPADGFEPEKRACAALVDLVVDAWPTAAATQSHGDHRWEDFDPHTTEDLRANHPDLPPAAVALSLRVWGRMHGLVTLEVYGRLRTQTTEPGKLYEAELDDLVRSLGLG
ncbi:MULTISPECIES: TetR/AcrR family transcriptional regulator [unclassified Saccharothrix]|uniref:TetR/AcrR family transcriptional regulator n=1 Tax=unclassified Saccharothrix TaxID=2593673 RepID=UPI00307F6D97